MSADAEAVLSLRERERVVLHWFMKRVQHNLEVNAEDSGKAHLGWRGDSIDSLMVHLKEEVRELQTEVAMEQVAADHVQANMNIIDEAADVAAMAMMVADKASGNINDRVDSQV